MIETIRQELAAVWARILEKDPNALPPAAVDSETFYRTEKKAKKLKLPPVTVELQGNWGYCRQPEWECYMVTIWSPANPNLGLPEINYAGPPENAPWAAIAGRVWVSHNRNFDRHVYERLVELGKVPGHPGTYPVATHDRHSLAPSVWHDTADLAVAAHLPRALDKVMAVHWKLKLDKDARADMDGRRWSELNEEEKQRMLKYASVDAMACCLIWLTFSPEWSEFERELSLHTGNIEFRGIPVNTAQVDKDIGVLEAALWKTRNRIPWVDDKDEKGKPYALRSKRALDRECLKCGVPPPASTAQKSKDFLDWLDEYGEKVPAIYELARYRRIDRALSVYKALKARIRPDGRAALGLKYMGAAKTGRWSGANKFNLQNLIKVPLYFDSEYGWLNAKKGKHTRPDGTAFAVDVRACLTASPGRKLLIPDLSQIEPRVLNWVVGNKEFLRLCAGDKEKDIKPLSPYEAHAASSGFKWEGKMKVTLPGMYAYFKARVLSLGYAAGWHKFIEMARGYCESEEQFLSIFAVEVTEEQVRRFLSYLEWMAKKRNSSTARQCLGAWPELDEQTQRIWVNAWTFVRDFRDTNSLIAGYENAEKGTKDGIWQRLDKEFKASVKDGVYENELPSGRVLKYWNVTPQWGWSCRPNDVMAKPQRTYGGLLTENLVQAIARDVFAHGILNLERAGYVVLFHVHDEAIVDAPMDADPEEIMRLLCDVPSWCKSLPVASECEESEHYKK
jgi:hypothetical protein